MATTFTSNTFANVYKDDYRDSDNYYRVLFNSGKTLQARELTQLQTIIQSEIGRFARNIFNEGAVVSPGGVTVNNKYEYLRLDTSINQLPAVNLVGEQFVTSDTNITVEVLQVVAADALTGDPATLYIKYIDTADAPAGNTTIRVPNGSDISNGTYTLTLEASGATGTGTLAAVASGEYFTKDHFVFAEKQTHFISKYTSTPTVDLGFLVTEDIVTATDNSALYDNQGAVPNTAAPGADRYRIKLTLTTRDEVDSADNFLFIARVVNGVVSSEANGTTEYNKINELMAQRTREESGDYIVTSINAKFEDLNDSNLTLNVSGGIAYVDGYRLESPITTLTVPKAYTYASVVGENVVAQYGNYINQDSDGGCRGLPGINNFEQLNLRTGKGYGGSTIGTARVRAVERNQSKIRHYLFDIQMNSGQSFASVKSVGLTTSSYFDVEQTDGIVLLQETANNSLLFPLPNTRPTSNGVTVNSLTVQRRYAFPSSGSGTYTLSAGSFGGSSLTFVDTGDWIITKLDGSISATSASFALAGSPTGTTVNITGLENSTAYELIALVDVSTPTVRAKSVATQTLTKAWPTAADSDGNGLRWLTLNRTDVIDITNVRVSNASGRDLSENFILDNGQRDNFYALGRLVEKTGLTVPTGDVYVEYRHFQHDPGHFFSVNSYASINYNQISNYRKNNGEIIALTDVLDFRPAQDSNGTYIEDQDYVSLLPQNTNAIDVDVDYYLPRRDTLVLKRVENDVRTNRAEVKYIQGVPDFQPAYPEIPSASMELYNIELNPYTINDSDLTSTFVDHKRYTMQDIGRLDKRVSDLEKYTTLTLLENSTAIQLVLDSAGNPRTKSGFLADNFRDTSFAEPGSRYRASIDPSDNTLNPPFISKNIRLAYDSDNVSNTVQRSGDLITLPYTSTTLVNQNLATETMNINPFAVITQVGYTTLSPSSDQWVETRFATDVTVNGGTINNVRGSAMAGWTFVGSTTTSRTLQSNRVIDVQVLPWMRSKMIQFKSVGLRPNTRYFPYFNNVDVSNWCREETTYELFSSNNIDYGNKYSKATAHPDGSSTLISDATGQLIGSYFLPSTTSTRFRTGPAEFKLLDVSGNNDANAVTSTRATYISSGTLETRQRTFRSTRIVTGFWTPPADTGGGSDPLAQSFTVDRVEHPNGLFITQASVYVATKDAVVPIRCEIVTVENGYPTQTILPGAVKALLPAEVNIPADTGDLESVRAAPTVFTFDEPVFLAPGQQYAIVLKAESTSYNVYVAKTYDFLLGTTSARVNRQPTLGSLFQSQNSSTWTADQTRDMMFKLHKAEFATTGSALLENGPPPEELLDTNPIRTNTGDSDVHIYLQGHGFITGDIVTVADFAEDSIGGISAASINGSRVVTGVDWTGFTIGADSTADTTLKGGGDGIIVTQQAHFDEYIPMIETLLPEGTTVAASAKFTSGGSYAGSKNRTTGTNTRAKASTYSPISINSINYTTEPKVILTTASQTKFLSGAKSATIKLDLVTDDVNVSPVIDLQRTSLTLTENVIDKQDAVLTSGYNVPLVFVAETDPTEGTTAAKHITKQVTLQEPGVGLKILLSANRPSEADFEVYYKTGTGDDVLDDKSWILVNKESVLPADNDRTTYREYEYLAGGTGGTLPPFTTYQVKIVMTSTNSSRIPKIRDLRIIALAT